MKFLPAFPEMCCFVAANSRKPRDEPLKDPGSSSLPYNPSCLVNLNIIYINCWTLTVPPIKFSKTHVKVKITNYKSIKINFLFKGYFANHLMVIHMPQEKKIMTWMKLSSPLIVHLQVFMHLFLYLWNILGKMAYNFCIFYIFFHIFSRWHLFSFTVSFTT